MWYNITRHTEYVEIENLDNNPIELIVIFSTGFNDDKTEEFTIPVRKKKKYEINTDGKYTFTLTQTIIKTPETVFISIDFYNYFLERVILTLEEIFCGCGDCDNCDDCDDQNMLLYAYAKVFTYYTLMKKYYAAYVDAVLSCQMCDMAEEVNCLVSSEKYLGDYNNLNFLKKILAYYYLSFYFAEVNEDNEEEIKIKFNYNTIISCLKGINIECIKQNIENMGLFTINSASYINQAPTEVGDYTLSVPNRTITTLTSAMFTTGTTPAYSDPEGDPADAVRIDSLPADGELQLNGTPVSVGDIISISDIDAGLLKYVSPNQDALDQDTFNFSVRDTGSLTFVS